MKKIFILTMAIAATAFSSCTMIKETGSTQNTGNSRLQVVQRLQANPDLQGNPEFGRPEKMATQTMTRSLNVLLPNTDARIQLLQRPIVQKYKAVGLKSRFGTNSLVKTVIAEKINAMSRSAIKDVARYQRPVPATINPSLSEDLKLCLIFLIGLVVFAILGFFVVHLSLLALITGILLFLCLAGFLIFLGIYLYKKKQLKKTE